MEIYRFFMIFALACGLMLGINAQETEEKAAETTEITVEELIKALSDDDFETRQEAEEALGKKGKQAVDAIASKINQASSETQLRMLNILKKILKKKTDKYKAGSAASKSLIEKLIAADNKLSELTKKTIYTIFTYKIYRVDMEKELKKDEEDEQNEQDNVQRIIIGGMGEGSKHGTDIFIKLQHPSKRILDLTGKCKLLSFTDDKGNDLLKAGKEYIKNKNGDNNNAAAGIIAGFGDFGKRVENSIGKADTTGPMMILGGMEGSMKKDDGGIKCLINVCALPGDGAKALIVEGVVEILVSEGDENSTTVSGEDLLVGFEIDEQDVKLVSADPFGGIVQVQGGFPGGNGVQTKSYKTGSKKIMLTHIKGGDVDVAANDKGVFNIVEDGIEPDEEYTVTYKKINKVKVPVKFTLDNLLNFNKETYKTRIIE